MRCRRSGIIERFLPARPSYEVRGITGRALALLIDTNALLDDVAEAAGPMRYIFV
jgi:hypothetical protein